jgi:dolichol-phosphate mannosyltransferase
MYKNRSILLVAPAYNEEDKIGAVVRRTPRDIVDEVLVVDDGSTDRTAAVAREQGATVLSLGAVKGVGFAIRRGFEVAAERGFDVAVVIAGNNKDNPQEIPRLLDPICDEGCDFVIGSRFLEGGAFRDNMPLYRRVATRVHPWLVGLFCGTRITESTNGFRAMRVAVLQDRRIDLYQDWLDHYELEVYLLMKLIKLGYRVREVPCSKTYPPKHLGQTKMRPVFDWWRMLKPVFAVGLGLRR